MVIITRVIVGLTATGSLEFVCERECLGARARRHGFLYGSSDRCGATLRGSRTYLTRGSVDRSANTTPGNKKGGLSNIVEKAMGSIVKSGSVPISGVLAPGQKLRQKGLVSAATPASDFICGTLQLAAGHEPACVHHRARHALRARPGTGSQGGHEVIISPWSDSPALRLRAWNREMVELRNYATDVDSRADRHLHGCLPQHAAD